MYDAIIVGAGPAGTCAALYGHRLGLKTLVLDKSQFPRDKTCGDAFSGKSVKIMDDLDLIKGVNDLDGSIIKRIILPTLGILSANYYWIKVLIKNIYRMDMLFQERYLIILCLNKQKMFQITKKVFQLVI